MTYKSCIIFRYYIWMKRLA
ncbi:hypothetical protein FG05_35053 [Fusarium graminearum]|nr:hypothetical protein FG05_35053 [Fusarium graminearum]